MKLAKKIIFLGALAILAAAMDAQSCQNCPHLAGGYCMKIAHELGPIAAELQTLYKDAFKKNVLPSAEKLGDTPLQTGNNLEQAAKLAKKYEEVTTDDPQLLNNASYEFINLLWAIGWLANNLEAENCQNPQEHAAIRKRLLDQTLYVIFGANDMRHQKKHAPGKLIVHERALELLEALYGKLGTEKKE
ncbi:MAG: hypothetical protein M1549_00795 [Candidatus Dependentiae bacterium]|nr:hypothetical protein [Candidatus Dependentiae bacterium]